MDGLHPPLHTPEDQRHGQGQNLAVDDDPADAINLGLTKMAESCPGTTYAKLSWLQARTSAMKPIRRRWPSW